MQCVFTLSLLINIPKKTKLSFQILEEEDPEYYRALKAGEFLWHGRGWLLMGVGCRRVKAWLDSSLEGT